MIQGEFAWAFGLGMVATINPCGFAMLPAYLGLFVGMDEGESDPVRSTIRSLQVGTTVTAGFMTVFLVAGIAIQVLGLPIEEYLSYATVVIGGGLIVVSIAMLRGFSLAVNLPHLEKGGDSTSIRSMYLFGISYAVASISCTIPLFLALTTQSFSAPTFAAKVGVFLAYSLGMGLVLMVVTLAIGLAKTGVVTRIHSLLPKVTKISAVLLLFASSYIVLYGYFEIRVNNLNHDPNFLGSGVVKTANDLQASAQNWVSDTGPLNIGVVLAGIVAAALVLAWGWNASRPNPVEPVSPPT